MKDGRNMSALRAIYKHGVFRPLETVNLPEGSEVLIEPRLVAAPLSPTGRQRIYQILGQRFESGEDDVAARHREHQP
jgi:predicted DNA-binding antitoxin AbrB/MazE fold protein